MIKSVSLDWEGNVKYEYCKMHNEYPNCYHCPYKTNKGYCADWMMKVKQ